MKKLRLLWTILRRTKADRIILGFIIFLFAAAFVIQLAEPDINNYRDAIWYCYAVLSTTGFGDIVVTTFIAKLCSILITIYTLFTVAIVTGVVVNYYNQVVQMHHNETLTVFMDKLERLPELPQEELERISTKVKSMR